MSYQVLARKWRPKRFSDVVGQTHVTQTIQNALRQGRLAHAFLFTGPRGVGKTSTARILARAVNCPNIDLTGDAEPCNECETCGALFEDREMDVIEMDAASNNSVDDIRRLNESCRLSPVAGRKKIYILDEVHMITPSGFNAFLKTLEEPPSHVIFILATTNVEKVPATIRSRVQRFDFRPLQPADVAPHLLRICEAENWPAESAALWLIARRAEGSLRDAEGLLDQVASFSDNRISLETVRDILGVLPSDLLAEATRLLISKQIQHVPPFLEKLSQRGVDYSELLRALQSYWMDLVFLKEGLPIAGRGDEEIAEMGEAGAELSVEDLFRSIRLAENLEDAIKWSTTPRIRFEVAFLRWVTLDRVATIKDILNRIEGHAHSVDSNHAPIPSPRPVTKPAIQVPAATENSAASAKTSSAQASGDPAVTFEDIKTRWTDVVTALRKRSPRAATMAGSNCELVNLDGKKLTIRSRLEGNFGTQQLKENFTHLEAALSDVFGLTLTLIAAPPSAKSESAKSADENSNSASEKSQAAGSDLFSNMMDRFGGVEIDPKKAREPR